MTEIIMYKTTYCPYCTRARDFLARKGFAITKEIDVTNSDELRQEMLDKSGGRKTVPQIFINGIHIGGYDDTVALDKEGKLDKIINGK
ncbi:MAG: glutaredoxin 3 [Rickettsiales bacterium]|nr:glutaredoxin 3 [Rickettsiales bacterium]